MNPEQLPNAIYYFFSTGAQCVAAVAGLSSTMAVFRYQGHIQSVYEKIPDFLEEFWKSYSQALSIVDHSELDRYVSLSMLEDKVAFWRQKFSEAASSWEFTVMSTILAFEAQEIKDTGQFPAHFVKHYNEILRFDVRVAKAARFRRLVIFNSVFGLAVAFFGFSCTNVPYAVDLKSNIPFVLEATFGLLVVIYMGLVVQMTRRAFNQPWNRRHDALFGWEKKLPRWSPNPPIAQSRHVFSSSAWTGIDDRDQ